MLPKHVRYQTALHPEAHAFSISLAATRYIVSYFGLLVNMFFEIFYCGKDDLRTGDFDG